MLLKEAKDFFRKMPNDTDYLGMKLLSAVFSRMNSSDEFSKKIVTNLSGISSCNIRIINSSDMLNSVLTSDDKSTSRMKISLSAHEMIVAHEFGHLLLDLFSNSELPSRYMEVNQGVRDRLINNYGEVSSELWNYSNFLYEKLIESIEEPMDFIKRNPEYFLEFREKYEDVSENDYISSVIGDYLIYMSNFDENGFGYNIVSNILDSSFHGDNPFLVYYGNQEISPLLTARDSEYFLEDDNGKYFAGFEEQFADYLVMKLYRDKLFSTINKLEYFIGRDWFIMMDEYYKLISNRVEEKAKSYRK